tara:strand:+ start:2369 stop:2548 length:180 start_codon:yes stop_codon:yes gene_type:complete
MGLIKGIFDLVEDVVSIPTDIVGITNHHEKKEILQKAKIAFMNDEISETEYKKIKAYCE